MDTYAVEAFYLYVVQTTFIYAYILSSGVHDFSFFMLRGRKNLFRPVNTFQTNTHTQYFNTILIISLSASWEPSLYPPPPPGGEVQQEGAALRFWARGRTPGTPRQPPEGGVYDTRLELPQTASESSPVAFYLVRFVFILFFSIFIVCDSPFIIFHYLSFPDIFLPFLNISHWWLYVEKKKEKKYVMLPPCLSCPLPFLVSLVTNGGGRGRGRGHRGSKMLFLRTFHGLRKGTNGNDYLHCTWDIFVRFRLHIRQ